MSYENQRRIAAETARRNFTKHGLSADPRYAAMYNRCRRIIYRCRTNQPGYADVDVYGPWKEPGGIALMVHWVIENLGPFAPGESIDRKNPFGDYVPGNLRKADARMQAANRRRARVDRLVAELRAQLEADGAQLEADGAQLEADGAQLEADGAVSWLHDLAGPDEPDDWAPCPSLCEGEWREGCLCADARAHRRRH